MSGAITRKNNLGVRRRTHKRSRSNRSRGLLSKKRGFVGRRLSRRLTGRKGRRLRGGFMGVVGGGGAGLSRRLRGGFVGGVDTPNDKTGLLPELQITTTLEETQKFIETLFSKISVCFVSGAFVFSDNSGNLSKFLFGTNHVQRGRWTSSHRSLKSNDDKSIYETYYHKILYTINCKKTGIKITDYDKDKCMLNDNDEPDNVKRDIRIIKWYPFNGKEDKKQYIYFKLEDWPTWDLGHITQAGSTYVLGNPNKSDCKSFREDCDKPKTTKTPKKTTKTQKKDKYCMSHEEKKEVFGDKYANKETYGRQGDEYYVDEETTKKILDAALAS